MIQIQNLPTPLGPPFASLQINLNSAYVCTGLDAWSRFHRMASYLTIRSAKRIHRYGRIMWSCHVIQPVPIPNDVFVVKIDAVGSINSFHCRPFSPVTQMQERALGKGPYLDY